MGKGSKKKKKKTIPVLKSDADFLEAFEKKTDFDHQKEKEKSKDQKNKHGLPVLDNESLYHDPHLDEEDLDFEQLLESSLKHHTGKKKTTSKPMALKKRLKRYPPPEADLDLHGFTAIGAQLKLRNFVNSCKRQGYFTVRIIVGRGLHSDFGAVLPDVAEDVVKALKQQNIVLSYRWEKKKKSRSGALIVYLKQFDQYD